MQVLLSAEMQLGDVLEKLLHFTGPAALTVSTFSTGEEFLNRLHRLRKQKLVLSAILYCDMKAAEKTAHLNPLMRTVYDEINLTRIHAKVMLIRGEQSSVIVLTSQNQTRGNRMESYQIINDDTILAELREKLHLMNTATLWTFPKN